MPKKFYSQTPVVSAKQVAGTNPIPGPGVGLLTSPTVPEKPGVIHGLGTPTKEFKHGQVKGSHGFGHPPHATKGHYRLSGVPNAHQLGKSKFKTPVVGR
jgi:hypothetical protein